MRILVDRLTDTPEELSFEASPEWLAAGLGAGEREPADERFVEPAQVRVRAHHIGADLLLEGELSGSVELSCGRCLTRYRQPIRERFRLVLEPAGARVPADPEGAEALARDGLYLSDELEAGWFRGSEIELDHFIRELVALALPYQPLCREDCRGLCPRCGVDRNQVSCGCAEAPSASPFAALGALKERLGRDGGTGGESR